ncbi:MAG: hypothetical protein COV35_07810 [Alphaproteobacteria bacterium CG11_big_fil_rev_8_21_14_0_20_39_49]|nr:MAG: hypothetical protein COV35_07810 [Alphaproteobacteria bacterium CG11_big_fil_rev_8_21_14_0_20_39_49]
MDNQIPQQTPPCPHYGSCGGCNMQHIQDAYYTRMKQGRLLDILNSLNVDESVAKPLVYIGEYSRRRVDIKVSVCKGEVSIGFYAPKSHEVVDIKTCLIMDKSLFALLPPLKEMISGLKKPSVIKSVNLTALEHGVDIFINIRQALHANDSKVIDKFICQNNIVRIAIKREDGNDDFDIIHDTGKADINLDEVRVSLPVGAFLQATEKGQAAITEYVLDSLKSCKSVADIYSGCGTYSFPLLQYVERVAAYEGAEDMVLAMHNAAIDAGLGSRLNAVKQDLYKTPVNAQILNRMDAVVINPPRNGALPQVKQVLKSDIQKIVMVSCNPDTFKRDAKYLIDGGYKIISAVAIDQFYWTRHLELVAVFDRCETL